MSKKRKVPKNDDRWRSCTLQRKKIFHEDAQ